uniref:Uncharacterized protein n=1 Tax=Knipowitschia caucasica TaxID=637954 RepID=A0AAV2LDU0_KNICA
MPSRYGLTWSPKSKPGSPTVGQSLEDLRCMFSWSPSSPRWRLWIVFLTCLSIVGRSSPAPPESSAADLMDHYSNSLSSILDIHAPLKTRTVNFTRSAPWYTNQHRTMKRSGRVLERAYTTSGLAVHKLACREPQKSYAKALSSASCVPITPQQ